MISHAGFGKLRLAQFRPDAEITELENWEFMDDLWVGEAIGFSEWLRLEREPETLRSLAIDLSEFPELAAAAVLRTIKLPVHAAMEFNDVRDEMGDPLIEHRFVEDRVSYEFVTPGLSGYTIRCTFLNDGGLTYLVVMVPLLKGRS